MCFKYLIDQLRCLSSTGTMSHRNCLIFHIAFSSIMEPFFSAPLFHRLLYTPHRAVFSVPVFFTDCFTLPILSHSFPYWKYAEQAPSLETIHAPIGCSGVQPFPNTLQSQGLHFPCSTSPQRQAGFGLPSIFGI